MFKGNHASGSGGALSCDHCVSILLNGSTLFEKNVAGVHGGAIRVLNPASKITRSLGSVFQSNTAKDGDGGAVYVVQASVAEGSADRTSRGEWTSADKFDSNVAVEGSGGSIYAIGTLIVFKNGSVCSNNRAMKGGGGCILWEPLAAVLQTLRLASFWNGLLHLSATAGPHSTEWRTKYFSHSKR